MFDVGGSENENAKPTGHLKLCMPDRIVEPLCVIEETIMHHFWRKGETGGGPGTSKSRKANPRFENRAQASVFALLPAENPSDRFPSEGVEC